MVYTGKDVRSLRSVATSKWTRSRSVVSAMRSLTDTELIRAMREYPPAAWREFDARFRPILEHYAERSRIPEAEWSECIGSVLSEEAVRLIDRTTTPSRLTGYLIRAVRHRWMRMRREAENRHRLYRYAANDPESQRPVVRAAVSEATRQAANNPVKEQVSASASSALRHWMALVRDELTEEEAELLEWAGDLCPRPMMAEWLGMNYHALRKKVTRTIERARALARACEHELPPEERKEIRRLLRRAGVLSDDETERESTIQRDAGKG